MKKKLTTVAAVIGLLLAVVLLVNLTADVVIALESEEVNVMDVEMWRDPELGIDILSEPNAFPNLMGVLNAEVGGRTYENAVVNMIGGRVRIASEAVCLDTVVEGVEPEAERLPVGTDFSCLLTDAMYLMGGYTYYGYYRTQDGPFRRLPMQTQLAPITLQVVPNSDEMNLVKGSLGTGLHVAADTTARLYLTHTTTGYTDHYETGMYQFHILAVRN